MISTPFDLLELKLDEARNNLRALSRVFVRPKHKGAVTFHMAAQMSCPGTVLAYFWHDKFKTYLHGFIAATRSVPDIIQTHFGFDTDRRRQTWLTSLDPGEQQRRQDFTDRFRRDFIAFNDHPLSGQRRKSIHFDGLAKWHVEYKGRWKTYHGDSVTPLDQAEIPAPPTGDPALDVPAMMSPAIHIQPQRKDFWLGPIGDPNRTPLFDECASFLGAAEKLVATARKLFGEVHEGHTFTVPTWR